MKYSKGFTLFELLVVLLIVGLLAGMMMPRLATMYNSVQASYGRDEVVNRLNALSYEAFQRGKGFELSRYPLNEVKLDEGFDLSITQPDNDIPLELPTGWELVADTPIRFFSNGVCTGGKATIKYYQQTYSVEFIAPFCKLQLS